MCKGVFHMGGWKGWFVNSITVGWLVFAIVFFSFPYSMPASVQSMNYTCVVVGSLPILIGAWWLAAGERYKKQIAVAKEE